MSKISQRAIPRLDLWPILLCGFAELCIVACVFGRTPRILVAFGPYNNRYAGVRLMRKKWLSCDTGLAAAGVPLSMITSDRCRLQRSFGRGPGSIGAKIGVSWLQDLPHRPFKPPFWPFVSMRSGRTFGSLTSSRNEAGKGQYHRDPGFVNKVTFYLTFC